MKRAAARRADPAQAALQLTLPLFQDSFPAPPTSAVPPRAPARPPTPASPPQAPRQPTGPTIAIDGQIIPYWLRRSKRRTIGFSIDERGLGVAIPRWLTRSQTEEALREKSGWIVRQLANWREHAERTARLATRWEPGGTLRFLGEELVLALDEQVRGVVLEGRRLIVGLAPDAGAERLRNRVHGWLQAQARAHFASRIPVFAERLGVAPRRWALSSARTRWGSCTSDGSVRLNWRLMHFRADLIDYVIAHEIAHLRELDHGKRFWATVGELFPDFDRARAELRAASETGATD